MLQCWEGEKKKKYLNLFLAKCSFLSYVVHDTVAIPQIHPLVSTQMALDWQLVCDERRVILESVQIRDICIYELY